MSHQRDHEWQDHITMLRRLEDDTTKFIRDTPRNSGETAHRVVIGQVETVTPHYLDSYFA